MPTNEFSFLLKPSPISGIGVFAAHDITKGEYLRLFVSGSKARSASAVPEAFKQYCVGQGDLLYGPFDFARIDVGWYVNHSFEPNAKHVDFEYFACQDIKAGEEITVDYNTLGEPEEEKEAYY